MDYASLIGDKTVAGSLAARINYALIPAPELVKNAQDEIFARLRVREMRKSLTVTLAVGASTFSLPPDCLDIVALFGPSGTPIKRISDDRLLSRRTFDATGALIQGMPRFYGIWDNALQFDIAANPPLTLSGLYYAFTYLSAPTNALPAMATALAAPAVPGINTSFLTSRYSNLLWAVLLKIAYGYRKEWDAATRHAADAESLFQAIEQQDDLSYRGLDDDDYAGDRL